MESIGAITAATSTPTISARTRIIIGSIAAITVWVANSTSSS